MHRRIDGLRHWVFPALLLIFACTPDPAPWCKDREGDSDCDGTPDAHDLCGDSSKGVLTDAAGCSDAQKAGCAVRLVNPADGAAIDDEADLAWEGTCDVYLVQGSNDASFAPGATRTWVRTSLLAVSVRKEERYWRVVGGQLGRSSGASSETRELRWR